MSNSILPLNQFKIWSETHSVKHSETTSVWEDVSRRVTDVLRSQNRDRNHTHAAVLTFLQNVLFWSHMHSDVTVVRDDHFPMVLSDCQQTPVCLTELYVCKVWLWDKPLSEMAVRGPVPKRKQQQMNWSRREFQSTSITPPKGLICCNETPDCWAFHRRRY